MGKIWAFELPQHLKEYLSLYRCSFQKATKSIILRQAINNWYTQQSTLWPLETLKKSVVTDLQNRWNTKLAKQGATVTENKRQNLFADFKHVEGIRLRGNELSEEEIRNIFEQVKI